MCKPLAILLLLLTGYCVLAQPASREIRIIVQSVSKAALPHATVSLLKADSTLLRTNITDSSGMALFTDLSSGHYLVHVTRVGHQDQYSAIIDLQQETSFSGSI
ncbi:MAG TPA: carboxypeptidase-like regulatory domain-containing protein, partial [Chitinophagaceae bacterium]|nr:carboxypeptidase-like regulatory domain-containing protein [Chitinophagaceae bacterium]